MPPRQAVAPRIDGSGDVGCVRGSGEAGELAGIGLAFNDIIVNPKSNETLCEFIRDKRVTKRGDDLGETGFGGRCSLDRNPQQGPSLAA